MISRSLFIGCLGLAVASLTVFLAISGLYGVVLIYLLLGFLWLIPELIPHHHALNGLRSDFFSNLCLFLFIIAAIGLLPLGWPWWYALWILILALAAWDLRAYRRRIYLSDQGFAFERIHVQTLGLVILVGLVMTILIDLLVRNFHTNLQIGWVLLIALGVGILLMVLARLVNRI